jgi:hypothetical protein
MCEPSHPSGPSFTAMANPTTSSGFDTTVVHPGAKDHFPPNHQAAQSVIQRGIRQFLDIGPGQPNDPEPEDPVGCHQPQAADLYTGLVVIGGAGRRP